MKEESYSVKVNWVQHYVTWNKFQEHAQEYAESQSIPMQQLAEAKEVIAKIMKL